MSGYSGKDFEKDFKESAGNYEDISIDRFYDNVGGYAGIKNICDFVLYRHPLEYYMELKVHKGNALPFSCITDYQWTGLMKKSNITGVRAGILIHFTDYEETYFVDIKLLQYLAEHGSKSLSIDWTRGKGYKVASRKRIKTFAYDVEDLLKGIAPEGGE